MKSRFILPHARNFAPTYQIIPTIDEERRRAAYYFKMYVCAHVLDSYRPGIRGINVDLIEKPLQGFILQSMSAVEELLDITLEKHEEFGINYLNQLTNDIRKSASDCEIDKTDLYLAICFVVKCCYKAYKPKAKNATQQLEFDLMKMVYHPLRFSFQQEHVDIGMEVLDALDKSVEEHSTKRRLI